MFPYGEDGFHLTINQYNSRKKVTCKQFYSYKLQIRKDDDNYLHYFKLLFGKYIVDMFVKMESGRLRWFQLHQTQIRADL